MRLAGLLALAAVASGCHTTFLGDQRFLERYTETIVLSDREGQAQVAVCPALQGRVMTSTATGPGGASYGWINYDLVASGATRPQINPYGGEDRFWLGPEGGPYSLFFKKGEPRISGIGRPRRRSTRCPSRCTSAAKRRSPFAPGWS